jgi:hypothetical protein
MLTVPDPSAVPLVPVKETTVFQMIPVLERVPIPESKG